MTPTTVCLRVQIPGNTLDKAKTSKVNTKPIEMSAMKQDGNKLSQNKYIYHVLMLFLLSCICCL